MVQPLRDLRHPIHSETYFHRCFTTLHHTHASATYYTLTLSLTAAYTQLHTSAEQPVNATASCTVSARCT